MRRAGSAARWLVFAAGMLTLAPGALRAQHPALESAVARRADLSTPLPLPRADFAARIRSRAADPGLPIAHLGSDGWARIQDAEREASLGRTILGSTVGGALGGALTGGVMAFTGWGLSGQSGDVAEAMAYVGGIPGVIGGSASGARWALARTEKEVGLFPSMGAALLSGGVGMIVWKQVGGEVFPEETDARWGRGLFWGFVTESVLTALLLHAF